MFWSFRDRVGTALVAAALAAAPAAADVTPRIAARGTVTAASNPFLLIGGDSALLIEGSLEPSLTLESEDGTRLALEGVLIGRQYSRIYGNFFLGSAQATGLVRASERLSITGLASYNRDIAADTITDGIGGAAAPRSIRNAIHGRAGATWRPNAVDTFTPELDYERVSYEDNPLLQSVATIAGNLGYSRRLSARTSLGMRGVARHSRIAGEDSIVTLAAYATGEARLSPVWRVSGDIGAERVEQRGTLPPGVQRVRTNLSGHGQLCADGERLAGCLNLGVASEASPLGGVQRRYTVGATANLRLDEALTLAASGEYSKAESSQQSLAPELGGASARLQLDWTARRRTIVSAHVEYRRREFGAGVDTDGVFAGVGIRWGS